MLCIKAKKPATKTADYPEQMENRDKHILAVLNWFDGGTLELSRHFNTFLTHNRDAFL